MKTKVLTICDVLRLFPLFNIFTKDRATVFMMHHFCCAHDRERGCIPAALAGSLYAVYFGFVSPEISSPARAADPVVVYHLGGVGTLYGPIVGAIAYPGMKDLVSGVIVNWELLIGFLLVFIMLAGEKGIWGSAQPLLVKALFPQRASQDREGEKP